MFEVRSDGILSPYALAVLLLQLAKECLRLLCVLDWIKIVACACVQHESATATVNCSLQLAQRLHDWQDKFITSTAEAVCCVIPIPRLYYLKRHADVRRRGNPGCLQWSRKPWEGLLVLALRQPGCKCLAAEHDTSTIAVREATTAEDYLLTWRTHSNGLLRLASARSKVETSTSHLQSTHCCSLTSGEHWS